MDGANKLRARLVKAGIVAPDMADLLWPYLEKRVESTVKSMTMRERLLIAVMQGLAVRWSFGDRDCISPQRLAEQAERLVNAAINVMERCANSARPIPGENVVE